MAEKQSIHMIVEGRVQGVGFRWFTERLANQLGVVGYVKNLIDGNVEVYAEGDEETLLLFRDRVSKGPNFSYVTNISECWGEHTKKYKSFEITY